MQSEIDSIPYEIMDIKQLSWYLVWYILIMMYFPGIDAMRLLSSVLSLTKTIWICCINPQPPPIINWWIFFIAYVDFASLHFIDNQWDQDYEHVVLLCAQHIHHWCLAKFCLWFSQESEIDICDIYHITIMSSEHVFWLAVTKYRELQNTGNFFFMLVPTSWDLVNHCFA